MASFRRRRDPASDLDAYLSGADAAPDGQDTPVTGRADCCTAPAAVRVVLAARRDERRPELLLCGHHYRLNRAALRAAGAVAYDAGGSVIRDNAGFPSADAAPSLTP